MVEIVEGPDEAWAAELACHRCGAVMRAGVDDLEAGRFKKPGTYWFDGSAERAGVETRIYVECPACGEVVFVDGGDVDPIPYLVARRLKASV